MFALFLHHLHHLAAAPPWWHVYVPHHLRHFPHCAGWTRWGRHLLGC